MGEKTAFEAAGEHDRADRWVPIDAARQLVKLTDKDRGHEVERRVRKARREDASVLLELERLNARSRAVVMRPSLRRSPCQAHLVELLRQADRIGAVEVVPDIYRGALEIEDREATAAPVTPVERERRGLFPSDG